MNRLTMAGMAVVLVGTVLIGGMLVSVALAATSSEEAKRTTASVAKSVSDADVGPVFDVGAEAAAATLAVSTDELSSRLADASLKQLADAREVGYGTVARAVNDAVSATLDAAVRGGSLSQAASG